MTLVSSDIVSPAKRLFENFRILSHRNISRYRSEKPHYFIDFLVWRFFRVSGGHYACKMFSSVSFRVGCRTLCLSSRYERLQHFSIQQYRDVELHRDIRHSTLFLAVDLLFAAYYCATSVLVFLDEHSTPIRYDGTRKLSLLLNLSLHAMHATWSGTVWRWSVVLSLLQYVNSSTH